LQALAGVRSKIEAHNFASRPRNSHTSFKIWESKRCGKGIPKEKLFCINKKLFRIEITVDKCRGNLPRVPQATGYGPKLLDKIGSHQRHMAMEPYTQY
jgi:hypothetical protein